MRRPHVGRLGVLTIVGALIGVGLCRRRVREQLTAYVAMTVASVWALLTLRPAIDLFPFDDWVADLGALLSDLWHKVKAFVRRVLEKALDLALDIVSMWLGYVWDSLGWLGRRIEDVVSAAWQWAQDAAGYAVWFAQQLVNAAWGTINWLGQRIEEVLNWLWGQLQWFYGNVLARIDNAIAWAVDHVWNGLTAAFNFAIQLLRDAVNWTLDQLNALVCGLRDLINMVSDAVGRALEWIYNTGARVASIVFKCMEWLVWFAAHPFDWFFRLLDDGLERGSEWFGDRVAGTVQRHGDRIEGILARWMGF